MMFGRREANRRRLAGRAKRAPVASGDPSGAEETTSASRQTTSSPPPPLAHQGGCWREQDDDMCDMADAASKRLLWKTASDTANNKQQPTAANSWGPNSSPLVWLALASLATLLLGPEARGVGAQQQPQQVNGLHQAMAQMLQVFNGNDSQAPEANHFKMLEVIGEDTLLVGAR